LLEWPNQNFSENFLKLAENYLTKDTLLKRPQKHSKVRCLQFPEISKTITAYKTANPMKLHKNSSTTKKPLKARKNLSDRIPQVIQQYIKISTKTKKP